MGLRCPGAAVTCLLLAAAAPVLAHHLDPGNTQAWIDKALASAYMGDRKNALLTAEKIKQFGGDYVAQADDFIARVNSGYFEKNPPK